MNLITGATTQLKSLAKKLLPPKAVAAASLRGFNKKYKQFSNSVRERNYVRSKIDYLNKNVHVRSMPYQAIVDTTNICNLQCPFCPTNSGELAFESQKFPKAISRKKTHLDIKKYEQILDAFGETLYTISLFNWGEPLLNKNLFRMIEMAKTYNIEVRLSSNLSIPDADLAEKICSSGLDDLIMSIDGASASTYSKYRRGGNFDVVLQNVRALSDYKKKYRLSKPNLAWQFLVFRHNEHELDIIEKFARSNGADEIRISGAYIYDPEWVPQNEQYRPLGPSVKDTCSFLYTTATIESTGALSPCCINRDERFDFGTFNTAGELKDLWNGDRIKQSRNFFRQRRPTENILCDACPLVI